MPAEDRHLGVLEVELVVEQHARDGGDDPGPVAAGDGEDERAHAASIGRRATLRRGR